jgi:hypothetical protein
MGRRLIALTDEDIALLKGLLGADPSKYTLHKKVVAKLDRSQRRITRSSAKGKGREFQVWVAQHVAGLLGVECSSRDDALVSYRPMSQSGVDVILRGEAREVFPFAIEAKAVKTLSLADAVEQAEANAEDDQFGVVAYRQTTQKPLVIFSWDTFERLVKRFILGQWL